MSILVTIKINIQKTALNLHLMQNRYNYILYPPNPILHKTIFITVFY